MIYRKLEFFGIWIAIALISGCVESSSPMATNLPMTSVRSSSHPETAISTPETNTTLLAEANPSPSAPIRGEVSSATPVPLPNVTLRPTHEASSTPLVEVTLTPTAIITPQVTAAHIFVHLAAPDVNFVSLTWHWRYALNLDWSPDSTSLVYSCERTALCLAQEPDFVPRLLVREAGAGPQPRWSPDGQQITFIYGRPYPADSKLTLATIAVIRAAGSGLRDLLPGDLAVTGPGAAAKTINRWLDNDSLSFMAHCGTECEALYEIEVVEGKLMPLMRWPDGILGTRGGVNYHWSPDEKMIAIERRGRWPCLLLLDTASGQEMSLAPCAVQWFESWDPDSQRLLYGQGEELYGSTLEDSRPVLHMWEMATDKGILLLPHALNATWSPDGRTIAFELLGEPTFDRSGWIIDTDFEPGQSFTLHVGLVDVDSREVIALAPGGITDVDTFEFGKRRPVWSPDGKQVVYWDGHGDLWVMNADGKTRFRLTQNLPVYRAIWSPDSSKLAFTTSDSIWVVERPDVQQVP